MTPAPALPHDTRRWHGALIAALMLLHVAPYPFATVLLDGSRDLSQAWGIVQGGAAWLGPRIDDRVHLGPVWFWMLAPLLAATKSVAAALVFEGVLASLKFPLAYLCGRRLLDARFGVFWALALALPGWNALQAMFPTHVNLVEAGMFAALLPLIALWQHGAPRWWLLFGAMLGLALHAHPSTVLLLPLALAVAWQGRAWWAQELPWGLGGVALAVLPFAPMLWHEAMHGWPMAEGLARGGGSEWRAVAGAPALAWGVFVEGPFAALGGGAGAVLASAMIAFVGASLYGWQGALDADAPARAAWRLPVIAALAFLLLAALRERTPFYMVYAWLPFGAAVLAGAWWFLWRRAGGRVLASFAIAACLAGALWAAGVQVRAARAGMGEVMAGSVADVRRVSPARALPVLPAVVLDRWGSAVCRDGREVVVHGDLGLLVDAALAMSVRMRCGLGAGHARVLVGGGADRPSARHVAGPTPGQWRQVFGAHLDWDQALAAAPLRVVASREATPVADGGLLELRPRSDAPVQERAVDFLAPREAAVQVGLPFAPYDGAAIVSVTAQGAAIEPSLIGASAHFYRCTACTQREVPWRVVLRTREPERLDIVLLTPPAAAASRD